MTDTKIQRLRGISRWLDVYGWWNMATNVREAADELERLGKIEAVAIEVLIACTTGNMSLLFEKTQELNDKLRDNQCKPTK